MPVNRFVAFTDYELRLILVALETRAMGEDDNARDKRETETLEREALDELTKREGR